ncbi:glycosyltransferase [Sorangium sp. So ce426]|uniref:glycosyltransferase n=1 Tax=Sorangium sp. So ce426 TaxID=3133312 RepID=UPI003F5BE151
MKLCLLIKYPPIQGGVSAQGYWMARALAELGHDVHVVSNADEVEPEYRIQLDPEDRARLEPEGGPGHVQLHPPEAMSRKLAHIPQANPFVSKLAGRAVDVIRRHGCELVFAYYFEPNGVAGHLAATWAGVPLVLRHAGSDLGRLMLQPDLAPTYTEIVRRADGIISGNRFPLLAMGAPAEAIYSVPPYYLPAEHFGPHVPPLDVDATVASLKRLSPAVISPGPYDPAVPTVGIYGKVGELKGSFDLVAALSSLKRRGRAFNLLALTQGRELEPFRRAVVDAGLADCTWILPFIPHWRVGQFIRACTAVCFLERDFTISFHAPSVPREVLACGTCLVLSGEILEKQPWKDQLVDGESFLLVPDPKDMHRLASALDRVVTDAEGARAIGRRGGAVSVRRASAEELGRAYEQVFLDVLRRRAAAPVAPPPPVELVEQVADLRTMLPMLPKVLGDEPFAALAAEVLAGRPATRPARAEADALLSAAARALAGSPLGEDAIAFSRHLLWMGWPVDGEPVARPFGEHADALVLRGERSDILVLRPLRSACAKVVRFEHLPESHVSPRATRQSGPSVVLFNKQANFLGHYFLVNDRVGALLDRCDGSATVAELCAAEAAARGPREATAEAQKAVLGALRRLYRSRVLLFLDAPALPPAAEA